MTECNNLENCNFFKTYQHDKSMNLALRGFIHMFCQGRKQDQCVRKKISKTLGGSQFVPPNMLPNGLPIAGTKNSEWSEEVKSYLK